MYLFEKNLQRTTYLFLNFLNGFIAFIRTWKRFLLLRDTVSGRAGWAIAHQEFGGSVNPIPTGGGADNIHYITFAPPPPEFWIS